MGPIVFLTFLLLWTPVDFIAHEYKTITIKYVLKKDNWIPNMQHKGHLPVLNYGLLLDISPQVHTHNLYTRAHLWLCFHEGLTGTDHVPVLSNEGFENH